MPSGPPLAGIYLHDATFLFWMACFAIQAAFIRQGRVKPHRRVGGFMAAYGFAAAAALTGALCVSTAFAGDGPPAAQEIYANDNRKSAGRLVVGRTLRIELEAREGLWYPESKDAPGFPVQAFGERGKELLVPGPQIRVPEGTRIRAGIRNTLPERMVLHGFHSRPGDAQDTVELAPGERRELSFDAGAAGTYYSGVRPCPARMSTAALSIATRCCRGRSSSIRAARNRIRKSACSCSPSGEGHRARRQEAAEAGRGTGAYLHDQRPRLPLHRTAHV